MSQPVSVDILSDDDDDQNEPKNDPLSTPFPIQSKRQRTEPPFSNLTVLLIDDDHPTPLKRPSFVPETPNRSEFGDIILRSLFPNRSERMSTEMDCDPISDANHDFLSVW
ncbi:hypothetical protein LOK49_LG09G01803 [Camellia lanceoleosa]|uniref:Uncharacterized protein n=1 Tax=Camellia lanceoleosa TaxID=1840588 RepID=A0ACC0GIV5_9ERIC|nr:hypothetical protein LOK49_LG09G01803 [Camellia lanceoleosa]